MARPTKSKQGIAAQAELRCQRLAQDLGYELVDIETERDTTGLTLRVYVDRPEGMDMDACERYHRALIPLVENLDYVEMAESLDIGTIINKKTLAAGHIYQMMLDADVTNVRSLMMVDSDVAEFVAAEGSKVTKKPVKDLGLPFGVTIGGLVRHDQGILVNGNTQIEAGDSVMVFCHEQNLKKVEKFFKANILW